MQNIAIVRMHTTLENPWSHSALTGRPVTVTPPEIVYELYGLTEEEIEVVEETVSY